MKLPVRKFEFVVEVTGGVPVKEATVRKELNDLIASMDPSFLCQGEYKITKIKKGVVTKDTF